MKGALYLLTAPVLLYQARQTRRYALRLPEPAGDRQGVSGQGTALRVLVLGDSAAAGVGCEHQSEAITGQWVRRLAKDYEVHWQLVACSGLNCAETLSLLKQEPLQHKQVDAVLISVGVNDVTGRTGIRDWYRQLEQLSDYLTQTLKTRCILYTALPPMHAFPVLPGLLRRYLGDRAKTLDVCLRRHCEAHTNTFYLEPGLPLTPEMMATDGFHPSTNAVKVWAEKACGSLLSVLHEQGLAN
ncbi:SGNH/GDSL hydrolase family protein [Lacimicrobium sp. SS2-24]|uniref:SGNH/GDSL hydrolase family protein n=1 Tax=Lacimicrobium sp. SS2-24 TaxID=2005569 RepID=UPI000B4BB348|nr:SGNH/GDSL hydrolase family protein [Lacimicrobium sp. SS2-24]